MKKKIFFKLFILVLAFLITECDILVEKNDNTNNKFNFLFSISTTNV